MRIRLPRVNIGQVLALVGLVSDAWRVIRRYLKRGKDKPSRGTLHEMDGVMEKLQQLQVLKQKLEGNKSNPIIWLLLQQLDMGLVFLAGQAPEAAEKYVVKFAQTVLIWIDVAEDMAAKTATPWDDALAAELHQAAEKLAA